MKHFNIISIQSSPRSGSTWLQAIMESHPNIITRYQPLFSHAFKNYINKFSTKDNFNKFINDIYKSDDEFINSKSEFHIKNNINISIIPACNKININTIVMKNVHHNNLIELFIKLCPEIKIIGLIRNPCAVINSLINNYNEYQREWLDTDEWLTGIHKNIDQYHYWGYLKWKEIVDIFENIKHHYPNNIYLLQYETLVDNPLIELKKLFHFMDISFDNDVLDYIKKSRTIDNINDNINDNIDNNINDINDNISDYGLIKSTIVKDKWKIQLPNDIKNYIEQDIKNTKYAKYYI